MPRAETGSRSSFSRSHPEPQRPQLSPAETQDKAGRRPPGVGRVAALPAVSLAPQPGPGLQALSPTLHMAAESRGPWGGCGPLHRCWQVMCVGTACAGRRGQTVEVLLTPAGPVESLSLHTPLSLKARLVSISTFPDSVPQPRAVQPAVGMLLVTHGRGTFGAVLTWSPQWT